MKLMSLCKSFMMKLKGMRLNHDFYIIFGKQCRTEDA